MFGIVESIAYNEEDKYLKITGTCCATKKPIQLLGVLHHHRSKCGIDHQLLQTKFVVTIGSEKLDECVSISFLMSKEDWYYENANALLSKVAPDSNLTLEDVVDFFRPKQEQLIRFLADHGIKANKESVEEYFS